VTSDEWTVSTGSAGILLAHDRGQQVCYARHHSPLTACRQAAKRVPALPVDTALTTCILVTCTEETIITTQVSPDALDSAAVRQRGEADILRIADDVAAFCAQNAAAVDYEGAFPVEEFALIARSGLLAAPLYRTLGGFGLGSDKQQNSTLTLLRVLKKLGHGNLSVGRVYEGHVNALHLIQTFGAPTQVARAAADARDLGKLFGVWNTEAAGGVRIIPAGNGHYRLRACPQTHGPSTLPSG